MKAPPLKPARPLAESYVFLEKPKPTFDEQSLEIIPGLSLHKVDSKYIEELRRTTGASRLAEFAHNSTGCIRSACSTSFSDLYAPLFVPVGSYKGPVKTAKRLALAYFPHCSQRGGRGFDSPLVHQIVAPSKPATLPGSNINSL